MIRRMVDAADRSEQLIEFLVRRGAGQMPHAHTRTLLDHLIGTATILARWGQSEWLQHAGLIHSVYGTDAYHPRLLTDAERPALQALAGERAERLAHLFATTPRGPLLAGTYRWASELLPPAGGAGAIDDSPTRDDLDRLVLLHMANLVEQQPVDHRLLSRLHDLADHLSDSRAVTLPGVTAALETLADRDPPAGRARFDRYVELLAAPGAPPNPPYPGLPSIPFHDPRDFPLARHLESHQAAIRQEILALDARRFQRESEQIPRSGDWDVLFLLERGRRHDDVCAACPVTAAGIGDPANGVVTTHAGLIYASRMRAGTHIAAHRGPTNLRLRCHLGIEVPGGDCAIRVGTETRHWQVGEALVFDDSLEHEAWNRTDTDRIVLIADVWHPALTATEVELLTGLHRQIDLQAKRLSRYWAKNAQTAARTP